MTESEASIVDAWLRATRPSGDIHARLQVRKDIIREAKAVPCMDCSTPYPYYVMDFDHVRGEKMAKISDMTGALIDKLLAEIEKCDVVCANCHRERTFLRGIDKLSG